MDHRRFVVLLGSAVAATLTGPAAARADAFFSAHAVPRPLAARWVPRDSDFTARLLYVQPDASYIQAPNKRFGNGFHSPICKGSRDTFGLFYAARIDAAAPLLGYCVSIGLLSGGLAVINPYDSLLYRPSTTRQLTWQPWSSNKRIPTDGSRPVTPVVHTTPQGQRLYPCLANETPTRQVVGTIDDSNRCRGLLVNGSQLERVRNTETFTVSADVKVYDNYYILAEQPPAQPGDRG